ncbi:MAG: ParA family protein [Lachnospiraceae bacterium]
MKKTKVICFANNKGGSGKSTSCANAGYSLGRDGKKVLLIDGDMQLNLSLSFFSEDLVLEYAKGEKNLYHAVKNQSELKSLILQTPFENVDLIPSSTLMSSIEYELFTKWQRELILQKLVKDLREMEYYDYILMDAPPTLGGWVMNLLCASDYLIIPVESSPWGLFGLANMFEFFETTKQIAPDLSLMGVLVTKVDERKNYYKQTMEILKEQEDLYVFQTTIHVDSSVEWAQDNSLPVAEYKRSCRSAGEYIQFAKEIDKLCQ